MQPADRKLMRNGRLMTGPKWQEQFRRGGTMRIVLIWMSGSEDRADMPYRCRGERAKELRKMLIRSLIETELFRNAILIDLNADTILERRGREWTQCPNLKPLELNVGRGKTCIF